MILPWQLRHNFSSQNPPQHSSMRVKITAEVLCALALLTNQSHREDLRGPLPLVLPIATGERERCSAIFTAFILSAFPAKEDNRRKNGPYFSLVASGVPMTSLHRNTKWLQALDSIFMTDNLAVTTVLMEWTFPWVFSSAHNSITAPSVIHSSSSDKNKMSLISVLIYDYSLGTNGKSRYGFCETLFVIVLQRLRRSLPILAHVSRIWVEKNAHHGSGYSQSDLHQILKYSKNIMQPFVISLYALKSTIRLAILKHPGQQRSRLLSSTCDKPGQQRPRLFSSTCTKRGTTTLSAIRTALPTSGRPRLFWVSGIGERRQTSGVRSESRGHEYRLPTP